MASVPSVANGRIRCRSGRPTDRKRSVRPGMGACKPEGASDDGYAISEAIRFAEIGSDPANNDLYPKEYLEEIRGGISTWKILE